jgi:hypothetical protein
MENIYIKAYFSDLDDLNVLYYNTEISEHLGFRGLYRSLMIDFEKNNM